MRGVVRAVFAFVRRPDGGSPCGGRGAAALPRYGHEIAPPQEVAVLEVMEAGRHAVTLFS